MERPSISTIKDWVVLNQKREILFEGSLDDAIKYNQGDILMSRKLYEQYRLEM
jgi:hypothetical protein